MTSSVLSAVLGVLTLVSVVASAVAVARASLAKSTIETLQQSNAALTERVDLLVKDNERQGVRLAAVERENDMLRGLAAGTEAVDRVEKQLARANGVRSQEHDDILASIHTNAAVFTAAHHELLEIIQRTAHSHGSAT